VPATRDSVAVTGANALAVMETAGAGELWTAVTVLLAVPAGVPVPAVGASVFAVGMTWATALVTGARALATPPAVDVTAPVAGDPAPAAGAPVTAGAGLGAVLAGAAVLVTVPADLVTVLAAEVASAVDGAACPSGWIAVPAWVVVPGAVAADGVAGAAEAGEAGDAGVWAVSAGAAAWVTAVTAVVTGLVTVPTTEPTALVTEVPAAEPAGGTGEAGPASAETDVAVAGARGGAASVAAWACLEKSSRRNKIPAAAIANCATRTAARCASSCGIDSSYPQRTRPRTPGEAKARDQPCTAVEDEACCTVITVHDGNEPDNRRANGKQRYPPVDQTLSPCPPARATTSWS
jgi:hypothetical protein